MFPGKSALRSVDTELTTTRCANTSGKYQRATPTAGRESRHVLRKLLPLVPVKRKTQRKDILSVAITGSKAASRGQSGEIQEDMGGGATQFYSFGRSIAMANIVLTIELNRRFSVAVCLSVFHRPVVNTGRGSFERTERSVESLKAKMCVVDGETHYPLSCPISRHLRAWFLCGPNPNSSTVRVR